MTSLELALLQGALLISIAPVCAGIGNTIVTLIKHKTWVMPWVMYRRENSVIASVALGVTLFFGMLLPLLGFEGYAGTYGNIVALIAVLAIVGAASALLDAKSIVPMALCAYGVALLALGMTAASINGSDILLAMSGDVQISTVLVAIAIALVLIALRNDEASERTREARMLLQTAIGIFLVNLVAMMTLANLLTHEQPALNALILFGKAIGVALVIEFLAAGVRRHHHVTPERLVRAATFLGIFAIIATVWLSNPSL
jgi:hypothetical protein